LIFSRKAGAFHFPDPAVCHYLRNVELRIRIMRTSRKVGSLLDDPGMDALRVLLRPKISSSRRAPSEVTKETAW
jgi:hypothetical protein